MARKARSSPFGPCMTRSTGDVKRVAQELFVVHWLSMCGWFRTFFSKKVGPSIRYKVIARASKKGKANWDQLLASMEGRLLIGSLTRRNEESGFYLHAKDVQMFP